MHYCNGVTLQMKGPAAACSRCALPWTSGPLPGTTFPVSPVQTAPSPLRTSACLGPQHQTTPQWHAGCRRFGKSRPSCTSLRAAGRTAPTVHQQWGLRQHGSASSMQQQQQAARRTQQQQQLKGTCRFKSSLPSRRLCNSSSSIKQVVCIPRRQRTNLHQLQGSHSRVALGLSSSGHHHHQQLLPTQLDSSPHNDLVSSR